MKRTTDPNLLAHLEWLGFVQPTGLVVAPYALLRYGAVLPRNDSDGQRRLHELLLDATPSFEPLARRLLDWQFRAEDVVGGAQLPDELLLRLDDDELLRPTFAVREPDSADGAPAWQLLVLELPPDQPFDQPLQGAGAYAASPHSRIERLLRATGTAAGILYNGRTLRLVSAPRGESSGWIDFQLKQMSETAGRPIVAALRLLLGQPRLLTLPREQRLPNLLAESRKYQNEVSERLAEQVLHALYELLRGFQAANADARQRLLAEPLNNEPDAVYHGLLTVVLRLVFLLYAEERGMLPAAAIWQQSYGLAGLYERLREDAARHPDTMDLRYGAWAQLLVLFRLVYDGAQAGDVQLPQRHGVLFDPDRYPFLEGRQSDTPRDRLQRLEIPRVPDGTVYRALGKLLLLDGERISYRALDVEQIGSVYETMMGFQLKTTAGRALAIKAAKVGGAPSAVDLDALLETPPSARAQRLQDDVGRTIADGVRKALSAATTIDDLHSALKPLIDQAATPDIVPAGGLVLQPSAERRRSGSHYTPRTLTEPLVRRTLEPLLAQLREANGGRAPTAAQILRLKVLDPAMGSGAFLVEATRQLADALIEAWRREGSRPPIPPDEDEIVYARRRIAQQCIYGVDKNPTAVDLARVSLWLMTLAREHPFTFLDHALRHGDSLLGLTQRAIHEFSTQHGTAVQLDFASLDIAEQIVRYANLRNQIRQAGEQVSDAELNRLWREANDALTDVRLAGDLALLAFFNGKTGRERTALSRQYALRLYQGDTAELRRELEQRRRTEPALVPFHWEIEFPEVFSARADDPTTLILFHQTEKPGQPYPLTGFDAIVGNPPFAGKNTIAEGSPRGYTDWLLELHEGSHGNADLVAHFFRRAFGLLRSGGALGLIATNTLAQGDTRASGLRWIVQHGGTIYDAQRRIRWPGQAAVIVSTVHIRRGAESDDPRLDGNPVPRISAYLTVGTADDDPQRLSENAGLSFQGSIVLGMGFTFDDTDKKGIATPLAEMQRLLAANPVNAEVIRPYIGGEELNSSPTQAHHRYVINFGSRSEAECRARWPELMAIVERKVRPEREALPPKNSWNKDVAQRWWQFGAERRELARTIAGLPRVLAIARVSNAFAFTFLRAGMVCNEKVVVFPVAHHAPFTVLQSRVHEIWTRFFSSSLKDDLQYTPSDCFETFPLPVGWRDSAALEAAGAAYETYRAQLLIEHNIGLTALYNRFHDPSVKDADIERLRELHAALDRAVLDAYGWQDLQPHCEFLLDYAVDEEEEAGSRRKKPYRYRWPDEQREQVLARLLALNGSRSALQSARA